MISRLVWETPYIAQTYRRTCRGKDCAYLARETDALTILHKIVLSVYILKLGFGKCTKKFVFLPKF